MNFREIRRQDRLWDEAMAKDLLESGEFGFLAMCAPEGYGYGIPMSYVYRRGKRLHLFPLRAGGAQNRCDRGE